MHFAIPRRECRNKVPDKSKSKAKRRRHISDTYIDLLCCFEFTLELICEIEGEITQYNGMWTVSPFNSLKVKLNFSTSCAVRSLYYLEFYNSSHPSHLHAFQVGTFNLINCKAIGYKLFSETLFSRTLGRWNL